MPLKLFENLRDGELNPKEVLKNLARFKSDYSFLLSRAKYKKNYGEEPKILTPKQMLQYQ